MIIAEIFVCCSLLFLAILGLSSAVRALSAAILGERRRCLLSVVLLGGEDVEFTLRCALGVHTSGFIGGSRRIYAVDCGMDEEQKYIAASIAACNPCIVIIGKDQFQEMLRDMDFPEYKFKAG